MRLSRMTMRRWMTVVAVAGLSLAAVVLTRRAVQQRDYCLQQANIHARMEKFFRSVEKAFRPSVGTDGRSVNSVAGIMVRTGLAPALVVIGDRTSLATALAGYHAGLKRKYLYLASRPWLSVPPDPAL